MMFENIMGHDEKKTYFEEVINKHNISHSYIFFGEDGIGKLTFAKELAKYGIRVNAVAPGFIKTEMMNGIPEELQKKYLEAIPEKRFGTVQDVANVVGQLCSDDFSYMTGQVLVLDGGLSL